MKTFGMIGTMGVRSDSDVHDIYNIQDLLGATGSKVLA